MLIIIFVVQGANFGSLLFHGVVPRQRPIQIALFPSLHI